MIFFSHNSKDKGFVEYIAVQMAKKYGRDKVFYDSWSIQPGEGIIGRMNDGLEVMRFFFLFVTENSLNSKMVSMEWKNALMKSMSENVKFIPVRCDESKMPAILAEMLYLDLYSSGMDVFLSQIVDVIEDKNTFNPRQENFSNLSYNYKYENGKLKIQISADYFSEPTAEFMFAFELGYKQWEIKLIPPGSGLLNEWAYENISMEDGRKVYAHRVELSRGIKPKAPINIGFEVDGAITPKLLSVLTHVGNRQFKPIPLNRQP